MTQWLLNSPEAVPAVAVAWFLLCACWLCRQALVRRFWRERALMYWQDH